MRALSICQALHMHYTETHVIPDIDHGHFARGDGLSPHKERDVPSPQDVLIPMKPQELRVRCRVVREPVPGGTKKERASYVRTRERKRVWRRGRGWTPMKAPNRTTKARQAVVDGLAPTHLTRRTSLFREDQIYSQQTGIPRVSAEGSDTRRASRIYLSRGVGLA